MTAAFFMAARSAGPRLRTVAGPQVAMACVPSPRHQVGGQRRHDPLFGRGFDKASGGSAHSGIRELFGPAIEGLTETVDTVERDRHRFDVAVATQSGADPLDGRMAASLDGEQFGRVFAEP
jgi:hypothetical protein